MVNPVQLTTSNWVPTYITLDMVEGFLAISPQQSHCVLCPQKYGQINLLPLLNNRLEESIYSLHST